MSATIVPTLVHSAPAANPWLAGLLRRRILAVLSGITGGVLTIREADTVHRCGPAELGPGDLRASITVHHPEFWMALGLGGSVGAADAYVRGLWDADHLTAVVRLLCRNRQALSAMDGGLVGLVAGPARRLLHALRPNTVAGAARNIHAHYDIGNDLFRLMLDPTMLYSSAIFPTAGATLEEAQVHKCDVICKRLELRPGERLIEIGTGWGGLALHAARHYGARVTTTTISQQQYALAVQRVQEAGLGERITVLQQDYRTLEGTYDKLVSIEMVEAIGWRQYPTYLGACSRLLKPDGLALIQAITIADQEYERAKHEIDFIKQAIFPGSCIPSVTALVQAATRNGDLRLAQLDDHTPHYARTLALWRDNCHQHREAIHALGYGDAFRRLWDYYLCYCEGGFAERAIGVHHLLFAKPGWRQAGHKAFGYA